MEDVDFLVIGGGIAGLSAAARLARHGSVVVCEAESAPGIHASGRSAAFAHFDMDEPIVRALTAASMPHFEVPGARPHPALFIAFEGHKAALERLEANYRAWAPGVVRLTAEDAHAMVPVLKTGPGGMIGALLDPDGRKLDAHAMLEGHRRMLREFGSVVALDAPVTALRRNCDRWIVETGSVRYSTRVVVNAAGAWVDQVAALAGIAPIGIQPLRRTVITFDAPKEFDVSAWPFTKTVGAGFYIEPEGRGRLLGCPMDEIPADPGDAQPEEEDVALAAWRVEEGTTLQIRRIASKWAGLRSFAPDRRPVAGFDPAAEGFFWLAGQGGFGLQTSPALAMATEALACGLPWPDQLRAVGVDPEVLSPRRLR